MIEGTPPATITLPTDSPGRQPGTNPRTGQPDWGLAKRLYEESPMDLPDIATEAGTNQGLLLLKARKAQWRRYADKDVSARIAEKAVRMAIGADPTHVVMSPGEAEEAEYIEAAADLVSAVIQNHREILKAAREQGMDLSNRLQTILAASPLDEFALNTVAKKKAALTSIATASKVYQNLASSIEKLIGIEREVWNLVDGDGKGRERGMTYEDLLTLANAPPVHTMPEGSARQAALPAGGPGNLDE